MAEKHPNEPPELVPMSPTRIGIEVSTLMRFFDARARSHPNMKRWYDEDTGRLVTRVRWVLYPVALLALWKIQRRKAQVFHPEQPQKPSVAALEQFANWFPAPSTRKKLKKLIGDQAAHIDELHRQKQYKAAKWNWYCTWLLMCWYGLEDFVLGIAKTVRGKSSA